MKQVSRALLQLTTLLGLGAGIGGYVWWTMGASAPQSVVQNARAFDFEQRDVHRLLIASGTQQIELAREKEGWFVQKPVRMQAAEEQVMGMLEALQNLRPQTPWQKLSEAPAASEVGLSSPLASVYLFDIENVTKAGVAFGEQSQFNGLRYASLETAKGSRQIAMLPQTAWPSLVLSLQDLLERRVLGASHDQVLRLEVDYPRGLEGMRAYELERVARQGDLGSAGSGFVVHSPQTLDADERKTADLLRALSAIPVARFLSFDHENKYVDFELEQPAIVLRAEVAVPGTEGVPTKAIRSLRIGFPRQNSEGSSIVRVARTSPPWVGEVNAGIYHSLAIPPEDLIDTRILRFDRERVYRIEWGGPEAKPFAFERVDEEGQTIWREEETKQIVHADKIQALLLTFADLTGEGKTHRSAGETRDSWLQRYGFQQSDTVGLRFMGQHGAMLGDVVIGRREDDARFVRRQDGDWVARIPEVKLRVLPTSQEAWRVRSP